MRIDKGRHVIFLRNIVDQIINHQWRFRIEPRVRFIAKQILRIQGNTHDMNSVLGIGEKVIYIYEGHKEWEGTKDDIFTSTNERLNNFIFASDLLRKVKDVEMQGMEG